MARIRVSTTVDEALLARAGGLRSASTDAALLDAALTALLARHRAAEIDAAYAAYDGQTHVVRCASAGLDDRQQRGRAVIAGQLVARPALA